MPHEYKENRPTRNDEAQIPSQGYKGTNEDNYENRIEIILFSCDYYISFFIFGRRRWWRFGLTPAFQDDNQREEDEEGAENPREKRGAGVIVRQDRELKREHPDKNTKADKDHASDIVLFSHKCKFLKIKTRESGREPSRPLSHEKGSGY